MRLTYISSALGLILIYFGLVILSPIIIALIYKEYSSIIPYIIASLLAIIFGIAFRKKFGNIDTYNDLKKTEGLFIVVLTWLAISIIAAVPYLFYGIKPVDAFFEAVSGVTGTGSTILTDFSLYPHSFFFWRSMSQWLGGMGIIVLFIAVLPQLAVAGRQLFFAEAPGPTEEKITPRVRHTASALWAIYISLTVLEIILLILAGMDWFDAICNSFSTLSAGGFSPNPQSIMGYNSALIDWIIIVFMFLAGVNFALQYKVIITRKVGLFWKNEEFRAYANIILLALVMIVGILLINKFYPLFGAIRHALFQILTIITCTGFASQDFELWDVKSKFILFLLMLIGGSAGSAAGSLKVVRVLLGAKYMKRQIAQVLHPKAVLPIKLDRVIVAPDIMKQILAFIFFYFTIFFISSLIVILVEGNIVVGITGTAATMAGIGPGFGKIGPMGNFAYLSDITKLIFCFDMLAGRLELIPFIAMLHPDFWIIKK